MNKKDYQVFTLILEYIIKYFRWVVIFAAILILLSGVFIVRSNEAAIVLRFGRLVGNTQDSQIKKPGLHFAFPFFIDEIIKIPVFTVQELDIDTHYISTNGIMFRNVLTSGYLLTGDNNVVQIQAKIKYQIIDAVRYTLFYSDTNKILDGIVSGELTSIVSTMDIDSVLTSGRAELAQEVSKKSQIIANELNIGIAINSIELTNIIPPRETVRYFTDVRNAAVRKETNIQRAREQSSSQILSAQAMANAVKQTAISEQTVKLSKVHAEMAEFNGLYEQYVRNPGVIMVGRFRERVGAVLAKAGGSIFVPDGGEPPVIILP